MAPIIIANWKMHFTLAEAEAICNKLALAHLQNEMIIAPPAPYLAYLATNFPFLNFCAQNLCESARYGAYSGEYSAEMLKSCKINFAIIGHSERRTLFNETNEIVAAKVRAATSAKVTPIICIGESEQARQGGDYKQFLITQLRALLPMSGDVIIAYEPIWSIGTGELPTIQQLNEIFEAINLCVLESKVAKNVRLLYGGSVNLDNIEQILDLEHVNGVLVGKSSLDSEMLVKMLERLY